ncbi:YfjL-like protein [Lederbergia lenta]|uniref:Transporter YfjL n=1 Tax=Lederbergia lenta TaxID=1467 RepID=A0A2X4WH27_LEDLE|nr:DUF3139 domain-containing protein [Lederbergia lenta]MCM3112226.1 DUF3139 domain-containing protein [Lederbergia lenta]MEC2323394.1 DUF3139 domain-containing protein [Lederbergia lenta]SQI63346.1 transporter YfjL [Lederbergia lenta]
MKKKKWLYIGLLIILIVPILFFYQAFNGDPVSKIVAKKTLQSYLTEHYPEQEYRILDQFYNFKISGYTFDVIEIGDEQQTEYEFWVAGFFRPKVTYDGIYYANLDEPLMERISNEASADLTTVLNEAGIKTVNIDVQLEILQGKYDKGIEWSNELEFENPMYIHLIIDATNMNKEEMLVAVRTIQQTLDSKNFSYSRISVNGNIIDTSTIGKDDSGYVKYYIGFDKGNDIQLSDIKIEKQ